MLDLLPDDLFYLICEKLDIKTIYNLHLSSNKINKCIKQSKYHKMICEENLKIYDEKSRLCKILCKHKSYCKITDVLRKHKSPVNKYMPIRHTLIIEPQYSSLLKYMPYKYRGIYVNSGQYYNNNLLEYLNKILMVYHLYIDDGVICNGEYVFNINIKCNTISSIHAKNVIVNFCYNDNGKTNTFPNLHTLICKQHNYDPKRCCNLRITNNIYNDNVIYPVIHLFDDVNNIDPHTDDNYIVPNNISILIINKHHDSITIDCNSNLQVLIIHCYDNFNPCKKIIFNNSKNNYANNPYLVLISDTQNYNDKTVNIVNNICNIRMSLKSYYDIINDETYSCIYHYLQIKHRVVCCVINMIMASNIIINHE